MVLMNTKPGYQKKKVLKQVFVTIAVPAYNEEKTIKQTIKNILRLDYPKNKYEIIVINDGSKDKTKKIVKKLQKKYPTIKLINQVNKGKGAALNTALKITKGKYFICLDADSFVNKNALNRILPYFTDKNIAAILPVLKVKSPKNILQRMQWYEYLVNMFYKELMSRLNCVHVTPGPFSVYKTSILKKLKGFDPKRNLTEDLEMALRLQKNNYKIIQLLNTEVKTIAPSTVKELYKQRNRWYKGSIINAIKYKKMMFNRKYGDFGIIQMPTIILYGLIAIIAISALLYYSLKPYVTYFYHMSFVNFDFWTFIKNITFNFNYLDLNYSLLLVFVVMILVTLYIIKKSHIHTQEKVAKFGIFSLLIYLFFYFIILGLMWIGILFDMILGRTQKW